MAKPANFGHWLTHPVLHLLDTGNLSYWLLGRAVVQLPGLTEEVSASFSLSVSASDEFISASAESLQATINVPSAEVDSTIAQEDNASTFAFSPAVADAQGQVISESVSATVVFATSEQDVTNLVETLSEVVLLSPTIETTGGGLADAPTLTIVLQGQETNSVSLVDDDSTTIIFSGSVSDILPQTFTEAPTVSVNFVPQAQTISSEEPQTSLSFSPDVTDVQIFVATVTVTLSPEVSANQSPTDSPSITLVLLASTQETYSTQESQSVTVIFPSVAVIVLTDEPQTTIILDGTSADAIVDVAHTTLAVSPEIQIVLVVSPVATWTSSATVGVLQDLNILPSDTWNWSDTLTELSDYLQSAWLWTDSTTELSDYINSYWVSIASLLLREMQNETPTSQWVSAATVRLGTDFEQLDSAWLWTTVLLDLLLLPALPNPFSSGNVNPSDPSRSSLPDGVPSEVVLVK